MGDRVRVGVVGTSIFSELLHLNGLKSHPQVELTAICGRDQARAGEVARRYGVREVYADWREMLDRSRLDAAVVVAPDDLHYPITMHALARGLHVLCEKPLALSAAQAREMYDTAERRGVKHMTYFTWRWMPHYRHLRALAAAGYVGRPYFLDLRFRDGGARSGRYAWRYDAARANGVLGDVGSHAVDLARWLAGEVAAVQAQVGACARRLGPDGSSPLAHPANDDAHLLLRFASGAQGTVHVTGLALQKGFHQYVALHGEAGALEAEFPWQEGPAWPLRGGRPAEGALAPLDVPDDVFAGMDRSQPRQAQFAALFQSQPVGDRQFVDAILHDLTIEPSFYDGWKAQQILEAALQSESIGQRVSLEAAAAT